MFKERVDKKDNIINTYMNSLKPILQYDVITSFNK